MGVKALVQGGQHAVADVWVWRREEEEEEEEERERVEKGVEEEEEREEGKEYEEGEEEKGEEGKEYEEEEEVDEEKGEEEEYKEEEEEGIYTRGPGIQRSLAEGSTCLLNRQTACSITSCPYPRANKHHRCLVHSDLQMLGDLSPENLLYSIYTHIY